jgi:hypothetical protein
MMKFICAVLRVIIISIFGLVCCCDKKAKKLRGGKDFDFLRPHKEELVMRLREFYFSRSFFRTPKNNNETLRRRQNFLWVSR